MKVLVFAHIVEADEIELADGTIVVRDTKIGKTPHEAYQERIIRSMAVGSARIYSTRDLKLAEAYAQQKGLIGAY